LRRAALRHRVDLAPRVAPRAPPDLVLVGAERRLPRDERRAVERRLRTSGLHQTSRRREPGHERRARNGDGRLVRLAERLDAAGRTGVLRLVELVVVDERLGEEDALPDLVEEDEGSRERELASVDLRDRGELLRLTVADHDCRELAE